MNHVRRGAGQMTGMGDVGSDVLNVVSGGGYGELQTQLATLDSGLKASIVASAVAAGLALWLILGDR